MCSLIPESEFCRPHKVYKEADAYKDEGEPLWEKVKMKIESAPCLVIRHCMMDVGLLTLVTSKE